MLRISIPDDRSEPSRGPGWRVGVVSSRDWHMTYGMSPMQVSTPSQREYIDVLYTL